MIDERFRHWLARRASAPAHRLARAGVTPNQLTLVALATGVLAGVLVAKGQFAIGGGLWIASRVLDGYDGLLARVAGRTTWFGGYLDITADMAAYGAMALGFAVAMPGDRVLWLFVLQGYVLAITSTLALSSLLERSGGSVAGNRSIRFTTSVAEGGETTVVYLLIAWHPDWSSQVLVGWIALLAVTLVQRTWMAARLLR